MPIGVRASLPCTSRACFHPTRFLCLGVPTPASARRAKDAASGREYAISVAIGAMERQCASCRAQLALELTFDVVATLGAGNASPGPVRA